MKTYKHIIWDWNGTILDDRWLWVEEMNQLLRQRGIPELTEEQYQADFRFPLKDYYRELGFDFGKETFTRLALEFIKSYQVRWEECVLHDNARDVLHVLADHGLSHSVLSAIEHKFLQKMVQFHDLGCFFTKLVGIADHFAASKLENGKRHLDGLHVARAEVLFIGDTLHDFEVADAMGVDCLLVAHGHNSLDKLQATGVHVSGSMREIQEVLIESS